MSLEQYHGRLLHSPTHAHTGTYVYYQTREDFVFHDLTEDVISRTSSNGLPRNDVLSQIVKNVLRQWNDTQLTVNCIVLSDLGFVCLVRPLYMCVRGTGTETPDCGS